MIKNIFLAFVPLFVAVDAIGILPMFISFTQGISFPEKKRLIVQSVLTALIIAVIFILIGQWLFSLLGITIGDFMIAGGAVLFCLAITDLLFPGKKRRTPVGDIGSVPLGTPLIVGPAVLTTCLILVDHYGIVATLIAVVLNIVFVAIVFYFSEGVIKVLGKAGSNAFSKIMALFLAAIAIMMIRKGIMSLIYSN